MRFLKLFAAAFDVILIFASCAGANTSTEIPNVRELTSEGGYALRVVRGESKLEILSPPSLAGTVLCFSDTENYLICGDTTFPISAQCAASFRDYLPMAYPGDYGFEGAESFEYGGAEFTPEYDGGCLVGMTVRRGGVERRVTVTDK